MRSRDTDIVIIPGLGDSAPDHWQSRWQARLPNAYRVEQVSWDRPMRDDWVRAVVDRIGACTRPVVVVAHSLGVVALVQAATQGMPPISGAFLVTPPSEETIRSIPEIHTAFTPIPREPLPFPSLLVASRNDPFSTFDEAAALSTAWGSTLLDAGEAGHLNSESGHGPWPEGLMAFGGFMNKL